MLAHVGYIFCTTHSKLGYQKLFDNVPARREDFIQVSESACLFPLPFCSHRWLENIKVCQRALDMLSDVNSFVDAVMSHKGPTRHTCTCKVLNI
jgi:hypothetical protein